MPSLRTNFQKMLLFLFSRLILKFAVVLQTDIKLFISSNTDYHLLFFLQVTMFFFKHKIHKNKYDSKHYKSMISLNSILLPTVN